MREIVVGQPGSRVPASVPRHLLTVETGQVEPDGLLPFAVGLEAALAAFTTWVSSRRFAPRALKEVRRAESLDGVFLPFWSFGTGTVTRYSGKRGETQHRQVQRTRTNANGTTETSWENESRVEWHQRAGQVTRDFEGLVLPGCSPEIEKIPAWPLDHVLPFEKSAAAGKRVIAYDIEPQDGFVRATALMRPVIERDVRDAIGGDHQRVHEVATAYKDPSYTLILLPAWQVSYVYGGRTWSVLVNGSSGEVVGDRPYSRAKIAALIAVLAAVVAVAVLFLT